MANVQRTRSADGTAFVFETQGDGLALIQVGVMMCDRAKTRDLSAAL
jgi:hypothetical protein